MDSDLDDIDQDKTIRGLFNEVDKYYTVTFKDSIGGIYYTYSVEYGHNSDVPEIPPIKPSDHMYEYEFIGWDGNYTNVKKDEVIDPLYKQNLRKFAVTFIDGDEQTITVAQVPYGNSAVAPLRASKSPTENDYYIFEGNWDTDFSVITSDLEVRAQFRRVDRYYEVKFMGEDENGNSVELDVQWVEYDRDANDPITYIDPIEVTADYIITITSWDKPFNNIKTPLVVNANYEQVDRWYNIVFLDEDDNEYVTDIVEYEIQ